MALKRCDLPPVPDDAQLDAILGKRLAGETLSELERSPSLPRRCWSGWAASTPRAAGDAATYWRDRNNNTRMFRLLGRIPALTPWR